MYNYEYKLKDGFKYSGQNLEKIEFYKDFIKLYGVDIISNCFEKIEYHWYIIIKFNDLVYFKFY